MKISPSDIVTFVVIFILVSGLTGLSLYREDKGAQLPDDSFYFTADNGREYLFAEDGGTFIAYLPMSSGQYYTMGFRVDPRELDGKSIDLVTVNATYAAKSIYLTVNPFDSPAKVGVAKLELARSISLMNPVKLTDAFIKDSDPIDPDVPLKTCNDSTADILVIEFKLGNQDKVYLNGDCIVVEGKTADSLIEMSDRLGYALVGIY
jgi:hypothetical protein